MANRTFNQFDGALLKGVVKLYCRVSVGAAGAVTLQAWNPATRAYATAGATGTSGVTSVTRTGAGLWSILLQDSYQRVLMVTATAELAGGTATCLAVGVNSSLTDVNSATSPQLAIALLKSTASADDPASGNLVDLEITLQNSSAL